MFLCISHIILLHHKASISHKHHQTLLDICICLYKLKLNHLQVQIARQTVQFELESLHTRPEQEPILMDMIHAVSLKNIIDVLTYFFFFTRITNIFSCKKRKHIIMDMLYQ